MQDLKQIYADFGRAYENIQDFNDKILSNPEAFLSGKIGEAYKKYTLFDRCDGIDGKEDKARCMLDLITYAAEEENLKGTAKGLDTISETINDLGKKLQQAKDIKEAQDIANAIASEGVKVQVIQAQMDMQYKAAATKRMIKEEQAKQLQIKRVKNTNYDTAEYFRKAGLIK